MDHTKPFLARLKPENHDFLKRIKQDSCFDSMNEVVNALLDKLRANELSDITFVKFTKE